MIMESPRVRSFIFAFFLTGGFLAVLCHRLYYWCMHPLLISPDQSVYLAMAELLLQGKVPYVDFIDFNPPLIMYLNTIPVVVAHLLHWPDSFALSISVWVFYFFSVLFCGFLFVRHRQQISLLLSLPLLLTYALFTAYVDLDMGQREHFFTLCFMPFFFLRGIRHFGGRPSRLASVIAGLIAGVGLSLKPQFILIALCAEVGFLTGSGNFASLRATELRAVFVAPVLYAISFILLPNQALKNFFEVLLPVYAYGNGWGARCFVHMLLGADYFSEPIWQFVLALFLATFMLGKNRWLPPLVLICLAALFNYVSGGQAWTYRLLPLSLFARLLLTCEAVCLLAPVYRYIEARHAGVRVLAAALFFALASGFCYFRVGETFIECDGGAKVDLSTLGYEGLNPRGDFDSTFFAVVANTDIGDKVVHIGTGIRPAYPCQLQSLRPPGSRYLYNYLIMIQTAIEKKPELAEKFHQIEARLVEELGQDILNNRPKLVFVQGWPIAPILEKYHFVERYLGNYSYIGDNDLSRMYKLTDGKFALSAWPVKSRYEVVLPIIAGQISEEEAARQSQIPLAVLKDWLKRAKTAMQYALGDHATDKFSEQQSEIDRLNQTILDLNKELTGLRNLPAAPEPAAPEPAPPAAPGAKPGNVRINP